jgi:hypothetical protein
MALWQVDVSEVGHFFLHLYFVKSFIAKTLAGKKRLCALGLNKFAKFAVHTKTYLALIIFSLSVSLRIAYLCNKNSQIPGEMVNLQNTNLPKSQPKHKRLYSSVAYTIKIF